jgi:hypothetical protein
MTLRADSSFPRRGTGDSESQLGRGEPAATGRGAGLGVVAGEDLHETTVILWHGQYHADAMECWEIMDRYSRVLFGLRNVRVEGDAGRWMILAEAAALFGGSS